MMKKYVIIIFCFAVYGLQGQAEKDKMDEILRAKMVIIDSLSSVLDRMPEDGETLSEIIKHFMAIDKDSIALSYLNILIQVSENTNDKNKIGQLTLDKAELFSRLNQKELSIQLLNEKLSKDDFFNRKQSRDANTQLSRYHLELGQYDQSLKYALTNEEEQLANNDSIGLMNTYVSLGTVSFKLGQFEKCIEYFEKASVFCQESKLFSKIALILNTSMILDRISRHEEAFAKAIEAQKLAEEGQVFEILPGIYKTMGILYYGNEEYEKALSYCLKALKSAEKGNQDKKFYLSVYGYLAKSSYYLKNYEKSIQYYLELEKIDTENAQIREFSGGISNHFLIDAYTKSGDYKKAFETFKKYSILNDSFASNEQKLRLADITEKYENEKKQKEIDQLSNDNKLQNEKIKRRTNIIYGSIAFSILLLALSIIVYRNYRNRQKLKEATLNLDNSRLKHRFLRTQLNPHFLFHALNSIESYIYKGEKEQAASFLRDFSGLMRNILDSSDVDFISLSSDIVFIKKYMELQRLNYGFGFEYTIDIHKDVRTNNILIPPMLMQPFVENAIIHGAVPSNGHVRILITQTTDNLLIEIEDSGSFPLSSSKESKKLHRSMSTDIVKQRIANLRDTHDIEITYSILKNDLVDHGKKTSVVLTIPLLFGNFKQSS